MDVACVLPALVEGSGGHRTILSNLTAVIERGANVTFVLDDRDVSLREQLPIAESLVAGSAQRFSWLSGWDQTLSCDTALATSASSARPLLHNVRARTYAYFVQDWESWFNPMGDGYVTAELTYLLDWRFITIGDWLRYRLMRIDSDRRVGSLHFGAQVSLERMATPIYRDTAPVVMNWQPDKSRRLSDLTLRVAEELLSNYPQIPVLLFGSDVPPPADSRVQNVGMLSETRMLDLFSAAACVVHFSSSNPSRIPFEAVATGTPAIEFFGESTCFDFPRRGVHTVIPTVDEIVNAVVTVFDNPGTYLPDAASGSSELRTRTSEMERFADLLLERDEYEPLPRPNRTKPDLCLNDDSKLTHRYLRGVQERIGVAT